jgi:thiamine-phosphate pyrophosphorylase
MKLIVMSSSKTIENEAQIITKLFEAGLQTFHLRKQKLSTKAMKELLNKIPSHFRDRIIIHSHHNLALKFNLKGIHLTQSHLTKKKIKTWVITKILKLKNPKVVITASFNNVGQLYDNNHYYNYTYVFLSPIFDSLSSKFQGGFTERNLKVAIEKTSYNVIARGGVAINSIEKASAIGFKGLVFYSYLWQTKDPVAQFELVLKKFQDLQYPVE